MKTSESFKLMEQVVKRKLEGLMVHDALYDAFCVMGMKKYACLHKRRAADEFKEFQEVKSYTIKRYGHIPNTEGSTIDDKSILNFGQKYSTDNLNIESKKRILAYLLEYIVKWESETINCLGHKHAELLKRGAYAEALYVGDMIKDTDSELDDFIYEHQRMADAGYNLEVVDNE